MDKLDEYKKKSILSGVLLILCNAFISFVFNSGALITYNIFYVAIDALLFMLPSKVSVLLGSAYFTLQVLLTAAYGMKNAGFLGILLCFLALALVVVHIKFMFRYINALKKIAKENLRKHEEQKNADSPSVIMSSNKKQRNDPTWRSLVTFIVSVLFGIATLFGICGLSPYGWIIGLVVGSILIITVILSAIRSMKALVICGYVSRIILLLVGLSYVIDALTLDYKGGDSVSLGYKISVLVLCTATFIVYTLHLIVCLKEQKAK